MIKVLIAGCIIVSMVTVMTAIMHNYYSCNRHWQRISSRPLLRSLAPGKNTCHQLSLPKPACRVQLSKENMDRLAIFGLRVLADEKRSSPDREQPPMRGGQHLQCQLRPQATQSGQLSTTPEITKSFADANTALLQGHVACLLCRAPLFTFSSQSLQGRMMQGEDACRAFDKRSKLQSPIGWSSQPAKARTMRWE